MKMKAILTWAGFCLTWTIMHLNAAQTYVTWPNIPGPGEVVSTSGGSGPFCNLYADGKGLDMYNHENREKETHCYMKKVSEQHSAYTHEIFSHYLREKKTNS